jgi:hypothetical protein
MFLLNLLSAMKQLSPFYSLDFRVEVQETLPVSREAATGRLLQ